MSNPFDFLTSCSSETIHRILADETPLFEGVVLGHLAPHLAAQVLANMNSDRQHEVVAKMSKAKSAPAEVVQSMSVKLRQKMEAVEKSESNLYSRRKPAEWKPRSAEGLKAVNVPEPDEAARKQALINRTLSQAKRVSARQAPANRPAPTPVPGGHKMDGLALAAEILRYSTGDVRHNISDQAPKLYNVLRERMFSFDDLELSEKDSLAKVFANVTPKTAALALRFASPSLNSKVISSVSPRLADLIRDELDASARDRVRVRDIEDSQQKVLETALKMQAAGEILIDPNDPDLVE
ncbi:MAG: hypothetical protein JXR97_10130 [Planctomycetes bacterium]|nr:hypothetical protein [Planctomycetota bacterium]